MKRPSWQRITALALMVLSLFTLVLATVPIAEVSSELPKSMYLTPTVEENEQTSTHTFQVPADLSYVVFSVGLTDCCPNPPDGYAVVATVSGPGQRTYGPFDVMVGECHRGAESTCYGHSGNDWVVLVEPQPGEYVVRLEPNMAGGDLPSPSQFGAVAHTFPGKERARSSLLQGNNIYWYYPDGSSKFVKDGGYLDGDEFTLRVGLWGSLTVAAWAAVFLLWRRTRAIQESPPES